MTAHQGLTTVHRPGGSDRGYGVGPNPVLWRGVWPLAVVVVGTLTGYLAVQRPALLALAVAALAVTLVGFRRPDLVLLAMVPMSVAHVSFGYGGDPGAAVVVTGAVGVCLLVAVPMRPEPLRPRVDWTLLCVVAFGVLLVASTTVRSTVGTPVLAGKFGGLSHLVIVVAGLLLLVATIWTAPDPAAVARLTALTGGIIATHALLNGSYNLGRLEGLGLNSNYLAAVLAPTVGVGIGLARQSRRPYWLVPAAVCLFAVQQTQSRGGMLAAVAGIGVALLAARPTGQRLVGAALVAGAGGLAYAYRGLLWALVFGSRPADQLGDSSGRTEVARAALDAILQHPFTGIGYRMFPYYALGHPEVGRYLYTHDDYLGLAAEAGLPAALIFLTLVVGGLTAAGGLRLTAVRAGVAAGAVNLVFANILVCPVAIVGFWIGLGCLLAHGRHRRLRPGRPSRAPSSGPSAVPSLRVVGQQPGPADAGAPRRPVAVTR
ncbi:O-antigen ligase family protein [Micromonospora maritima]|uniref:O-antigen ligase family protein n=1 Tax=Micromonospora maritima TaxID=986711 RepID=A0ABW7ZG77_9ACTN